jgi:hypothetical protein
MLRSLAVILIPVVIITYFFTRTPGAPTIQVVDYAPALSQAREQAPYEVLAPAAVPAGWRATRATWLEEGGAGLNGQPSPRNLWQLGFLTDADVYVELDQGDLQSQDLVADRTRDGVPDGESSVGEEVWQRRISADERTRSLVLTAPQVTTIVFGDLPYADLESFAATLRTD